jgi:hypothetical protein
MEKQTPMKGKYLQIHPLWYSFIKYCEEINAGEIEKLKIQDGVPVSAETVKKKIKFFQNENE